MTVREASPDDAPQIAGFLRRHLDQAMFPLANLADHGMGREGRYQMRFWLKEDGGAIVAALGLSAMGMLLPVLPGCGAGDMAALRAALAGETVRGIIGATGWARGLFAALAIPDDAVQHSDDEPGFALDLSGLVLPGDPSLTLRVPGASDAVRLVRWRAHYLGEVVKTPPHLRVPAARADIKTYLAQGSHRLLLKDGLPVALTGFNAVLPEAVQVGGVYTPPDLRGRGYARAAVALHLAEACAAGVPRALLFAANAAAARAYQAIGFRPNGHMTMIVLHDGARVAA